MKVIFCDIDGVLNSEHGRKAGHRAVGGIEERKVKALKKIIDNTGAVVVIASRANSFMGTEYDLQRRNSIKSCGVIPYDSLMDIMINESKAKAINRWLRKHNDVTDYVVVDDCKDDLQMYYGKRFIHIKSIYGLTNKTADKVIEIFKTGV